MRRKTDVRTALSAALFMMSSGIAVAAPFGAFDARSAGMGNIGVASGTMSSAPFFNPALLTAQRPQDRLSVVLPAAGVHLSDTRGLIDDIKDFQSAYAANDSTGMLAALDRASGKAVLAQADGGVAVAGAYQDNGAALSVIGHGNASAEVIADSTTPQNSSLYFRDLETYEAGVSLAHRFDIAGIPLSIGLTPKHVIIRTHDYATPLSTASTNVSDLFSSANQTEETTNNIDAGIVLGRGYGWRAGLVARNLQRKQVTTINGNLITLKPQSRVGVSYSNHWVTVGADMDLTENPPIAFEDRTKMVALGTELNLADWVQLRAGWQHNRAAAPTTSGGSAKNDIYSAGLGFSPGSFHLDAAAMTNGNKHDIGGFAQMSVQF